MALATSVDSARVGRRLVVMDSSIWVAVMTGLPARLARATQANRPQFSESLGLKRARHPQLVLDAVPVIANDVVLETVTITYTWDDPALTTPTRTFAISGTIPAGGTGDVTFQPIALGDLTVGTFDGHSANMDMLFMGRTAAGGEVPTFAGGLLTIDSCP